MFIQVNDGLINMDLVVKIKPVNSSDGGLFIEFRFDASVFGKYDCAVFEDEKERDATFQRLAEILGSKTQDIPIMIREIT